MNNKLKYLFAGFIALFVCGCFVACGDDDDVEIDKWAANYVYLQRPALGIDLKQFNMSHTGAGVAGDTEVVLPLTICLLKPYENDVKVKLGYATNGEFPEEIISFRSGGILVIPAGEVIVRDTMDVTANWALAKKPKTDYIATAQIESVEPASGALRKSENQSKAGLIISKSTFLNLSFSTSSVPSGTAIADRSVWKIIIQPGVENADNPGRLVDNNTSTDIAADLSGFWLTIDLTKTTTVTGFRIRSWGATYAPRGAEIFTSDDGATWESQGEVATSGLIQYITLQTPVTCRHIKYEIITGASSGRLSLTEFYVYEQ